MQDPPGHEYDSPIKKTAFEYFFDILGWIQIIVSPFLAGLVFAAIVYFSKPSKTKLALAVFIIILGLSVGITWAV